MIHQPCCSIWRSQWHFNLYFHWIYSYIQQSYHTYTHRFCFKWLSVFGSCLVHCRLSDRCLSVCQTFAPNSRNGQPLISHSRIAVRPTPEVSVLIYPLSKLRLNFFYMDYILNLPSSLIMEILGSPHHSFTGLKSRTTLNCLTKPNCLNCRTIHTYFAHDNWSMCALRPEYKP